MTTTTVILTAPITTATSVLGYFDWNTCHDDHHRDGDGDERNNDYWG